MRYNLIIFVLLALLPALGCVAQKTYIDQSKNISAVVYTNDIISQQIEPDKTVYIRKVNRESVNGNRVFVSPGVCEIEVGIRINDIDLNGNYAISKENIKLKFNALEGSKYYVDGVQKGKLKWEAKVNFNENCMDRKTGELVIKRRIY